MEFVRTMRLHKPSPMQAVLGSAEHVDMPLCGNRGKLPSLRERVDAPLRGGRGGPSKTVDEDVGTCFMGKHFGVRLFEGVCFPIIGRGYGRSKPRDHRKAVCQRARRR